MPEARSLASMAMRTIHLLEAAQLQTHSLLLQRHIVVGWLHRRITGVVAYVQHRHEHNMPGPALLTTKPWSAVSAICSCRSYLQILAVHYNSRTARSWGSHIPFSYV